MESMEKKLFSMENRVISMDFGRTWKIFQVMFPALHGITWNYFLVKDGKHELHGKLSWKAWNFWT